LREAEAAVAAGGIAPKSLLDRALRFWEDIYQRELEKQEHGGGEDTPAHQHLRMEYSLVLLWRHPSTAIEGLYALYRQGRLK
jgi:hypothetical protein